MREAQTINWAGGEHPFLLRMGEILALEEILGCGISEIFERLRSGQSGTMTWRARDVSETLRLGLIGAGMDAQTANKTVKSAIEDAGYIDLVLPALLCMYGSLAGPSDDASEDKKKDNLSD